MGADSKIEWTDHTFNPWVGCTKVSPGCDHCYAEAQMDTRRGFVQWGPGKPRKRTVAANWRHPVKWNAQAEHEGRRFRVFCASLADVFDNEVPTEWRADLFDLIQQTPHLDWLLLTKRIGNAKTLMADALHLNPAANRDGMIWPLPNVWLGASIVNQEEANRDIPKLLAVPAAKRFLSMEPLLGPVNLERWLPPPSYYLTRCGHCGWAGSSHLCGTDTEGDDVICPACARSMMGDEVSGLDWVIVGGESGPNARPMHPDWARSLLDQCTAAGVPFLFKQWGEWGPGSGFMLKPRAWVDWTGRVVTEHLDFPTGASSADRWAAVHRAGKKAAGRLLDGRTWDEVPG